MRITRLYVTHDLAAGASVGLSPSQAHYLSHVLRLKRGDPVHLFNGRDGEWQGDVDALGRGWCSVEVRAQTRPQPALDGGDLWLVFAPVKRARIDFIAAKATELGAAALWPVMSEHTAVGRVNADRLHANAIEAAEQCGRLTVPEILEPDSLRGALARWPEGRRLLYCDESGAGAPIAGVLEAARGEAARGWAVLTGPEGGFARAELDALANLSISTPVSLGPRILRADTAAIAALACWQAVLGDWRQTRTKSAQPAS
jgi:16S rRNA (uracil1498-N3)-methyltransferase